MRYAVTLPTGSVRTRTSEDEPLTHAVVVAVTAAEMAEKKNSVDIEDYPEDEVVLFRVYSWACSREQAYRSKDRALCAYRNVRILPAAPVGSDPITLISSGVEVELAAFTEI